MIGNPAPAGRLSDVGQAHSATMTLGARETAPLEREQRELLLAAARGDEAAARALYRAYVDRVHRHVARILGPNHPDADDVVQQVFLAALDGAARFDGRSKVSTWLLGIATRRALDAARGRARRERWRRALQRIGIARSPPRPDVRQGARSEAEAILGQLRPEQRTVFVLHEVEGYTFAEIREMTGTGISTLHARLESARRRIEALAHQDGEAEAEPQSLGGRDGAT